MTDSSTEERQIQVYHEDNEENTCSQRMFAFTHASAYYGFISVPSVISGVKTGFPLRLELLEQFGDSHSAFFAAGYLRCLPDGS